MGRAVELEGTDAGSLALVEAGTELLLLGVGEGVGFGDGEGFGAGALDSGAPDPSSDAPGWKMTMLAVVPLGIVTTQKLAPPAPEAWSELVTPPTPSTDGSMEHGVPLQPGPEHTILIPKVGVVWAKDEPVYSGFHPILAKVLPLPSVFAPATYAAQLPSGFDPSPQMQASSTVRPGVLI